VGSLFPGVLEREWQRSSVGVVGATACLIVIASLILVAVGYRVFAQLPEVTRVFAEIGDPSLVTAVAAAIIGVQMAVIAGLVLGRSRRRRTELSFRENEEAMALAASSANIGLWSWDIAHDKVRATPHCKVILGLSGNEPCNLRTFLNCIHPDDRAMLREAIEKGIESRQKFDVEHRIIWPGGDIRWIAASGRAKYGQNQRAVALTGVFVDITHRKEAEAEADRQRTYVTHLTRVGMLGELSGAVAHELNQPLTAILSNAQAAQRMLSRPSVDLIEVRNTIRDIIDDDSRAGGVIRHLRALLTKSEAKFERIDLNKVVTDALDLARADLIVRQVRIVKHLGSDLPLVVGDQIQLQQVILNLILNASESLMANASDNRELRVSTLSNDGSVEAVFADNGAGFAPEIVKKLFEPFFSTKEHGLGLGLPISRSIMTAHGGELWAESNPEGGAIFHIKLPALVSSTQ
jgi:PAS domain S-box-containing protein